MGKSRAACNSEGDQLVVAAVAAAQAQEAVLREPLDLLENGLGELLVVPARLHAIDDAAVYVSDGSAV